MAGSSSDSDGTSLSDEDDEFDEGHGLPAKTPLTAFLSFKQEAEKRKATNSPAEPNEKVKTTFIFVTFQKGGDLVKW